MVLNQISGKMSEQYELNKMLRADDLAVVADGNEELQKTLQDWSSIFNKHGHLMNFEKTEVMWICEQEVDRDVVVDQKTSKQVNIPKKRTHPSSFTKIPRRTRPVYT